MEDRKDKLRRADAVRRRLAGGRRPRAVDHRRLARTLSLGTLAVAAAIYWLAVEYGVDMRELTGYLGASFVFVTAACGTGNRRGHRPAGCEKVAKPLAEKGWLESLSGLDVDSRVAFSNCLSESRSNLIAMPGGNAPTLG